MRFFKHAIRKTLPRLIRAWLRVGSRPLVITPQDRVLVLAPHPDDESLGCGGTIAAIAPRVQALHVGFVTDEAGTAQATTRRDEAARALAALGVGADATHFLGAPDGHLSTLTPDQLREVTAAIVRLVQAVRPSIVFHPLHCDGSTEHEASFALVDGALRAAGYSGRLIEFPVWAHWWPHLLLKAQRRTQRVWHLDLGELIDVKRRAIASHHSQVETSAITGSSTTQDFAVLLCGPTEYFFERPFPVNGR